jgi:hypothetical protein
VKDSVAARVIAHVVLECRYFVMYHFSAHFFHHSYSHICRSRTSSGQQSGLATEQYRWPQPPNSEPPLFSSSLHSVLDVQKDMSHNGALVPLQLKCELIL